MFRVDPPNRGLTEFGYLHAFNCFPVPDLGNTNEYYITKRKSRENNVLRGEKLLPPRHEKILMSQQCTCQVPVAGVFALKQRRQFWKHLNGLLTGDEGRNHSSSVFSCLCHIAFLATAGTVKIHRMSCWHHRIPNSWRSQQPVARFSNPSSKWFKLQEFMLPWTQCA